jgi:hypothetical protein
MNISIIQSFIMQEFIMTLTEHLFTMEIFNHNTLYITFNLSYFAHSNYTIVAIDSFNFQVYPI